MVTGAIVETSDLVGAQVVPARRVSRFVSPIRQLEGKVKERRAHDDTPRNMG